MTDSLQEIIERAKSGNLTSADLQILAAAIQSGRVTLATGQKSVGIGGNADESVILTGSHNVVLNFTDTEAVLKILQQLRPSTNPPQSSSPRATLQQLAEISKFDLTQLIDQCLEELFDHQGLIGLAVPCSEKAFLKNFCDRLKQELGRTNIQLRQTLSLNPQVISVGKAAAKIKQYKKLLQTSDVICPIRISVCDHNSSIPKDFWQQLQEAFRDDYKYRLIIVMVGNQDCFPPDTVLLPHPQFKKSHAFQWIRDIAQAKNWMHLSDQWMQKMTDRCLCNDSPVGLLDVGLVYEHLDYTISLLQRNPSLTAEAFLEQLD